MERVTFQDPEVVRRVTQDCAAVTTNALPGFETVRLDDPKFGAAASSLADSVAKGLEVGCASANIATLLSNAEGEVLHVAPGFFPPRDLIRELDFALSVGRAVEGAGAEAGARRRACAALHAERLRWIPNQARIPDSKRAALAKAHELLTRRPLTNVDALDARDYSLESLDSEATLKEGRRLLEEFARLEARVAASGPCPSQGVPEVHTQDVRGR